MLFRSPLPEFDVLRDFQTNQTLIQFSNSEETVALEKVSSWPTRLTDKTDSINLVLFPVNKDNTRVGTVLYKDRGFFRIICTHKTY